MREREWASVFFPLGLCSLLLPAITLTRSACADEPKKPTPAFRSVRPLGVTSGKPAAVSITGQDLAPREIRFDQEGITAKIVKTEPLTPKSDAEKALGNVAVEVELSSPAGLKPGVYSFKLVHEGKDDPVGRVYIDDPLPETEEQEPNDALRQPQALPSGSVVVLGKLDKEGVDVFRIEGEAGELWRIEIVARRVGSPLEPILRLRDPRLAPVRAAVDQGEDCAIEYRLPLSGPYLLEVFDADNRSKEDFVYRLRVIRSQPSVSHPAVPVKGPS